MPNNSDELCCLIACSQGCVFGVGAYVGTQIGHGWTWYEVGGLALAANLGAGCALVSTVAVVGGTCYLVSSACRAANRSNSRVVVTNTPTIGNAEAASQALQITRRTNTELDSSQSVVISFDPAVLASIGVELPNEGQAREINSETLGRVLKEIDDRNKYPVAETMDRGYEESKKAPSGNPKNPGSNGAKVIPGREL